MSNLSLIWLVSKNIFFTVSYCSTFGEISIVKSCFADEKFCFACLGFLYAVGGHELISAEKYNPSWDRWHEIASMTTKRRGHQAVVINRAIYSIGKLNKVDIITRLRCFSFWNAFIVS